MAHRETGALVASEPKGATIDSMRKAVKVDRALIGQAARFDYQSH